MTATTHTTQHAQSTAETGARTGRLNVKINEDTARALNRLIRGDVNATEVVRRAVALLDFIETERAAGKLVELVDQDDETKRERVRFMY